MPTKSGVFSVFPQLPRASFAFRRSSAHGLRSSYTARPPPPVILPAARFALGGAFAPGFALRARAAACRRRTVPVPVSGLRLDLKRPHVAHRAIRLRSWFTALVLVYLTRFRRDHVNGDAARKQLVRRGRATIVGK